eukprot:TRINITY_DN67366_c2_g2_i3.p1 TRINITY_DN67366_c2_g2~~TRINITY_DN67366_c2_g2_i3.p1  ORF type:complete len:242 (+),score=22.82 TRINITY_DN67366_c2_g2_i3:140-865(+)
MLRSSSSLVLLLLLLPVLAAGLDVSTFNQTACTNAGHHWYTHNAAVCVSEHFWNNLFNLDVVQWGDNLGTTGGSSGMAGWVMIPFTLSEDKSVYRLCVLADGPLGHASLIERTGDTTGATVWFSAAAQSYNSPAGITIGAHSSKAPQPQPDQASATPPFNTHPHPAVTFPPSATPTIPTQPSGPMHLLTPTPKQHTTPLPWLRQAHPRRPRDQRFLMTQGKCCKMLQKLNCPKRLPNSGCK